MAALPRGGRVLMVRSHTPASCDWHVVASAYLRLPGSQHNYGIADLNYCSSSRDVYGSGSSYNGSCNGLQDINCVLVELYTNNTLVAGCFASDDQYGCNTASHSDANVQSYVEADMCINASCSQLAKGITGSY